MLDYSSDALWEVDRWQHNYAKLSAAHKVTHLPAGCAHTSLTLFVKWACTQAIVPEQPAKHAQARQCVQTNQHFLKGLVLAAELDSLGAGGQNRTAPQDVEKVRLASCAAACTAALCAQCAIVVLRAVCMHLYDSSC